MATNTRFRRSAQCRTLLVLLSSAAALGATDTSTQDEQSVSRSPATRGLGTTRISAPSAGSPSRPAAVRVLTIQYSAHNGAKRAAYVLLPAWYGPRNNPPVPVVISPHGRDATGLTNSKYFGNLPAVGSFAVISPDGMGRRLGLKSYGYAGQIDDLAKMPDFAAAVLPWLRIDRKRIYALGSSMGGHETLMLVARHPQLLAGAAAMDSVTDLARRYGQLPEIPCNAACHARWAMPYGVALQSAMRREVGGSPADDPAEYAARSPVEHARTIAFSGVPLQIWWSRKDRIVFDQEHQSEALFQELRRLNPSAPVSAYAGRWAHSKEMRASQLLPIALAGFNLLPWNFKVLPRSIRHESAPTVAAQ
jgi:poly(3-hydroxybutyrate) depolymerase